MNTWLEAALLTRQRFNIEKEVELDFPHLPPGCSIQLDRVAKQYVLDNIRYNLRNLSAQITERLQTFEADTGQRLTFGAFLNHHGYVKKNERLSHLDLHRMWYQHQHFQESWGCLLEDYCQGTYNGKK